jgi:hypothetical protein
MTASRSPPPRAGPAALPPLAVAAATALAYSNTFDVPFHFDDYGLLKDERLRDLGRLWPPHGARWLGDLSFALNHRVGGWNVFGFHAVNLAVHLGSALLVYALVAATLRAPRVRDADAGPLVRGFLPVVAAALFALHPLATQAVTYVVQRYASLATLLFLASLVLYARSRLLLDGERPPVARAAVGEAHQRTSRRPARSTAR